MTQKIDITIINLLNKKHKIENSNNWFSKSYWCKQTEIQKIDHKLQEMINMYFTKVLLPEKKYYDFTFDDFFEPYQEYYIIDYGFIPLGKYMNTHFHTEMIDSVQTHMLHAIFVKDSTGSNIYTNNDTIISRPIYIKTMYTNSVAV